MLGITERHKTTQVNVEKGLLVKDEVEIPLFGERPSPTNSTPRLSSRSVGNAPIEIVLLRREQLHYPD